MSVEPSRPPPARRIGLVYACYFVTALGSAALTGHVPVWVSNGATLLSTAVYTLLALLLYALFRPVNARLSAIGACFAAAGCIVQTLGVFHLATQREALFFFGVYCVLVGYLIVRSWFLPAPLGAFLALAGVGWLVFLSPAVPTAVSISLEALGLLAELTVMLWLLVFGVDQRRWDEQARAGSVRLWLRRANRV